MKVDIDAALRQQPGATLEDKRLKKLGELARGYGWRSFGKQAALGAQELFDIGWVTSGKLNHPIRVAKMRHCGFVVKDLFHLRTAGKTQFRAFGSSKTHPAVEGMRRKQIAANRPRYENTITPGQHKGETCYIIGNGPSAQQARDWIPTRDRRQGKVIAINGASKWFSGDMDYFATWDWMGRPHWYEGKDFTGCEGLFSLYAANRVVEGFVENGGGATHFYRGANRNPYRQFGRGLPDLEEGLETMFSVVHAAYVMGFRQIVLFGAEHAIAPEATDLHGGEGDAKQPDEICLTEHDGIYHLKRQGQHLYTQVPDFRGEPCWTTPHLHNGAAFLCAQSMWLADSGVSIVNCSQAGLEMIFAPHVPPDMVLADTEPQVYGEPARVA